MTYELENGQAMIGHLIEQGFDVDLAFWVKETGAGRWYLYLASRLVDEKGPSYAYRSVLPIIDGLPELGVDPLAIKVVGLNDSMTEAAREAVRPRILNSPFAVQKPNPYPGMTRFGGSSLGGMDIGGAYIYPPLRPGVSG